MRMLPLTVTLWLAASNSPFIGVWTPDLTLTAMAVRRHYAQLFQRR
jgi:hypothetical protein